jgi:Tetratricopeptide repeat
MTIRALLDRVDETVGDRFGGQRLVEAGVRTALARAHHVRWEHERALTHATRAAEVRARYLGPDNVETLESMHEQAWALYGVGRHELDVAVTRRLIAGSRRVLGPVHLETLAAQNLLARVLSSVGRFDEAHVEAVRAEAQSLRQPLRSSGDPGFVGYAGTNRSREDR